MLGHNIYRDSSVLVWNHSSFQLGELLGVFFVDIGEGSSIHLGKLLGVFFVTPVRGSCGKSYLPYLRVCPST